MTDETRVLYNETCPVCRFEIDAYAKRVRADGLPVKFEDLSRAADWGLTPDQAARRLHVIHKGALLSGMPAFRALWSAMPRWRFVAWLTGLPILRPACAVAYERVLAPALYRAHLKRQNRQNPPA
jgi:predicted DCC family thiol-disulfide oxidoreductase YuxK